MSSKKNFIKQIRNFGLFAHIDAGKTTTTERILYYTGKSYKMGEVHDGAAVMDWMDQEQERGITITAAATACDWKDYTLHLIDTPGHVDFTVEVERTLRILDGAIIIFDATQGVESQSESIWWRADKYKIPRIGFINKMDRLGADFKKSIESIEERLGKPIPLPIQVPLEIDEKHLSAQDLSSIRASSSPKPLEDRKSNHLKEEKSFLEESHELSSLAAWQALDFQEALKISDQKKFIGVLDLIREKVILWPFQDLGEKFLEQEIPEHLRERYSFYREQLVEKISEFNDELLEKFVNGEKILSQDLVKALREATIELKVTPILCGSAFKNKGIQPLLDAVTGFLPSPENPKLLKFRPIEGTSLDQPKKKMICKPDVKADMVALVFKVVFDAYMGTLVYVRIYSGHLKSSSRLVNTNSGKKEKVQKILKMHANHREEVSELKAGEIGAIVGLKFSRTGDTLCDALSSKKLVLESMQFPEPVISVAIEARSNAEREKMLQALKILQQEDPSCLVQSNAETAQTLLCGMGELHLEVLLERLLREYKLKIQSGAPQVSYRESIRKKTFGESVFQKEIGGVLHYARCRLLIQPLKDFEQEEKEKRLRLEKQEAELGYREDVGHRENKGEKNTLSTSAKKSFHRLMIHGDGEHIEERRKNPNRIHISFSKTLYRSLTTAFLKSNADALDQMVDHPLMKQSRGTSFLKENHFREIRISIQEGGQVGILLGFSLIQMVVDVLELDFIGQNVSEIALKSVVFHAFREALQKNECHLFEPIFKVEILTPESYTGNIISDFNLKRGNVVEVLSLEKSKHLMNKIKAHVPLVSLMGYATSLRSLSQGRAIFNMEFKEYAPMSSKEENALLKKMGL